MRWDCSMKLFHRCNRTSSLNPLKPDINQRRKLSSQQVCAKIIHIFCKTFFFFLTQGCLPSSHVNVDLIPACCHYSLCSSTDLTEFVEKHLFDADLSPPLTRSGIHSASQAQTSFDRLGLTFWQTLPQQPEQIFFLAKLTVMKVQLNKNRQDG